MQPVREKPLFEVEPHALDGVKLRRVGRQRHEREVGRHIEGACVMPPGSVEDHHRVLVLAYRCSEPVEEELHRLSVGVGQDEGEAIVGARLNASKEVGEGEALIAEAWWALAAFPPDVTGATFLADPRLVLEKEADALIFVRTLNSFQQCWGSF
jgi:hypothetical protein